ncbi:hypothetical protein TrVE_jg1250 [Triparma verrucosa]|uniref:Uncharacterized protein n=1 Tax=Triparma verrucosa TaxID=1606542 RepID=A0A9W7BPL2_9STRA|nr:hypothetical protein TrVE_jg1250 [Triparma verrucosa]
MWSSSTSKSSVFRPNIHLQSYVDFPCKSCGEYKIIEEGGSTKEDTGHKAETWGRKDDLKVGLFSCEGCGVRFRGEV